MKSAWALIAILAGTVLAGCGGSSGGSPSASPTPTVMSTSAYKQALAHLARQESQAQHTIAGALHAKDVTSIQHALTTFAADQQKAAAELTAIHPPANAVSANAALAAAFTANAAATRAVAVKVAKVHTARQAFAVIGHAKAAQETGQRIDRALAQLRRLGYTKGS